MVDGRPADTLLKMVRQLRAQQRDDGGWGQYPGSDIDLLVVLKDPVNPCEEIIRVSEATSRMSLAYDTVISCLFMQEERYLHENSPLLLNIRREGLVL